VNPLFQIPDDLSALEVDELRSFIEQALAIVEQVAENPAEHAEGRDLMAEMTAGVAAIEQARAELESREEELAEESEVEETEAVAEFDENAIAELATRARGEESEEEETVEATAEEAEELAADPEPEEAEGEEEEEVTASATNSEATITITAAAPKPRLPKPSRSRSTAPPEPEPLVPIIAAANGPNVTVGEEFGDEMEIARAMTEARRRMGDVPEGTHGDKVPMARATWSHLYDQDRYLGRDEVRNRDLVEAVTASSEIDRQFHERQKEGGSLTASGGLCAPVTPYYQLQMLSVSDRPVRAALPAFNADRGGIRYARPAALSAVTTAVGVKTAAQDAAGGSSATKSCQVIPCPAFQETDVEIIHHCLQFGNLGARTFPELVAQWNALVLAAHARTAEGVLLDGIGTQSTAVTAAALGLGASATLPSQILAAANGMRSRHRMRSDAVLRVLLPNWVGDLLVSDVYRSQFQRFDMDVTRFVALLRAGNVEPTFYIDGQTGAGQVFGTQSAGTLLPFPADVVWYLYPEGSFLYLDGGVLELGLVRDSVLNATNDFQIFGESFENVAFVGIESLKVTTAVCDSGTVSLPDSVTCPVTY
jgi:hypothetical protein